MKAGEFVKYIIAQVLGALTGAGILAFVFHIANINDMTGGLGSNGLTGVNDNIWAGLIIETLLTFIFVLSILGVTAKKAAHGHVFGVVIAFSLVAVHILGIILTGTSVNPARSIGPAVISAVFNGNGAAMVPLWIFVLAPIFVIVILL